MRFQLKSIDTKSNARTGEITINNFTNIFLFCNIKSVKIWTIIYITFIHKKNNNSFCCVLYEETV